MRDWCIYNLSLCNGSDDHNGKGIKGKVVSALRKPDIQYDYILANSRRLSESLFELYSLRVTVPSPPPPLPRWNKSHSMLSFPFIFRYDCYRHHFFISFNWYSKNYQTHNFFFLYRTWDDEVSSSKRHPFLHIRVSLQWSMLRRNWRV